MSATAAPRASLAEPRGRGRGRDLLVLGTLAPSPCAWPGWPSYWGRIVPPTGAVNDTVFYEYAAASLAQGHFDGLTGAPTAGWPPGYPFVISLGLPRCSACTSSSRSC